MRVEFTQTDEVNGCQANNNDLEVTLGGKFWGWVSGPEKGSSQRGWMALKGMVVDGKKVVDPFNNQWTRLRPNREAAVLEAL